MVKAAVLMMEGFEESETIQIVDLLKRASIDTTTFCFQDDLFVKSMQNMYVKADARFSEAVKGYDVLVIPGGRTAWTKLIANQDVMDMIHYFNDHDKYLAAMCSGTRVLHAAGVLEGHTVTGYDGYDKVLTDAHFVEDVAVLDGHIITSQGPATPYPFAFKIMEAFGINGSYIKERMLYARAGGL